MRPTFSLQLVNPPFGDPGLLVDFLFEKRALLFDLGDIRALSPRKLLRISHVFVSHTHMDHFMGFDWLLRVSLGRPNAIQLFGPPGILAQVEAKLAAYTWNLVQNYEGNFTLQVGELHPDGDLERARFACRERFQRQPLPPIHCDDGLLVSEPGFRVRATFLDHEVPVLGFALEEPRHVNLWKNRLAEMGLPVGPWLQGLKQAVLAGASDDTPICARWKSEGRSVERTLTLAELRAGDQDRPGQPHRVRDRRRPSRGERPAHPGTRPRGRCAVDRIGLPRRGRRTCGTEVPSDRQAGGKHRARGGCGPGDSVSFLAALRRAGSGVAAGTGTGLSQRPVGLTQGSDENQRVEREPAPVLATTRHGEIQAAARSRRPLDRRRLCYPRSERDRDLDRVGRITPFPARLPVTQEALT
jgi:ribonuclease BN (tRNA processing enzyme)